MLIIVQDDTDAGKILTCTIDTKLVLFLQHLWMSHANV